MRPKTYLLEWIDFTVNVTLNSAKNDLSLLTEAELENIIQLSEKELENQKQFLKRHTFLLDDKIRIRLINQYRASLVPLLDQAYLNIGEANVGLKPLVNVCESVIICIEGILNFIENNLEKFDLNQQKIPSVYLTEIKKEVSTRLNILRSGLFGHLGSSKLAGILHDSLSKFIENNEGKIVTAKELKYMRELVRHLENMGVTQSEDLNHKTIVTLLIYLNYNSKAFMNYYTQRLVNDINEFSTVREKIFRLLFHMKEFRQMYFKQGVILNPDNTDLKIVIENWFIQELTYLEKKQQWEVQPLPTEVVPITEKPQPFKVMCFLSVDQIAILLRSMDALRIFQAKSLNAVMKSIAPYLSTPRTHDISWESMRSKSYAIEESDREAVIKTLESMIKWIKEY